MINLLISTKIPTSMTLHLWLKISRTKMLCMHLFHNFASTITRNSATLQRAASDASTINLVIPLWICLASASQHSQLRSHGPYRLQLAKQSTGTGITQQLSTRTGRCIVWRPQVESRQRLAKGMRIRPSTLPMQPSTGSTIREAGRQTTGGPPDKTEKWSRQSLAKPDSIFTLCSHTMEIS